MLTTRRSFITGFVGLLVAPAIVRATSIMPVKAFVPEVSPTAGAFVLKGEDWQQVYVDELPNLLQGKSITPEELRHMLAGVSAEPPPRKPFYRDSELAG